MRTFRKWCCDRQWSRFLLIGLQDWSSMRNTFEHVEANVWSCLVSILALSMRVLSWQKPLQYHRIIGYHWDPVLDSCFDLVLWLGKLWFSPISRPWVTKDCIQNSMVNPSVGLTRLLKVGFVVESSRLGDISIRPTDGCKIDESQQSKPIEAVQQRT